MFLSFIFPFHYILYLLYRITFFVKLGSPQSLPETDVSHGGMVINIATEETLVLKNRRFFTHAVTVNAV